MMNKLKPLFTFCFLFLGVNAFSTTWHVSPDGSDTHDGSEDNPFATISKAASLAIAGDTVLIHEGVYRERVSPENGGISPLKRITYKAVPGDEVWLKGSEVVEGWKAEKGNVWAVEIPNEFFGDFNPFDINVYGDWLRDGKELHLGEVYIDGNTLIERFKEEDLIANSNSWIVAVDDEKTVIRANFGGKDPNESLVEINVRPTCFFPKTTGINYITVQGLKIAQAATQWSPPTGEQIGIIGPNWSKGWVIEDCEVSQSKCVGICLGKSRASGHNMWSLYRRKFGYSKCGFNREIEAIFKAYDLGWNKTNIGSHLIQNNKIFDCGQAGIVGHMGAAFSVIRNNEIYDINRNPQMSGAETAGIKLHAPIDTRLEHNIIINTTMGMWLDWQAQGTHVVGNVIAQSDKQDMFFEVTHGPTLVYNNILLSELGFLVKAQGIAFFNNLLTGNVRAGASVERYTPYHYPHSTKIMGLFNNPGGDVRFYNNLFLANSEKASNGLSSYNKYPAFSESLTEQLKGTPTYLKFMFPIWTGGNVYFADTSPWDKGTNFLQVSAEASAELKKKEDGYYLTLSLDGDVVKEAETLSIHTEMLGQTFISEAVFENPDGTSFLLDEDFFGNARDTGSPTAGPFEMTDPGELKVF